MTKIMKKLSLSAAVVAMSFSGTACAQQQEPTPVSTTRVAAAEVEMGGPALWKVADEDTTIYLFGTVHVLPEGMEWYEGRIAQALQSSDKLITEIYLPKGNEAAAGAAFMEKGSLPAGDNLRDLLSEEQKAVYESAMTKMKLPVGAFDTMEPWLAAVNISMIPLLQAGYTPESGVEKVLEQKAGDMMRGELESVNFQVDLFDTLPLESQIVFMMEAAAGVDEIVPSLDSMVGEWASGDPEELGKMMNEGFSDPVLANALLYSRNATWAEWIDTRLDTPGTIFIAVGAGHLAGEKSVQDALELRGIKSIRIQ
ncbi:TraB/GumN family protein [Pontixanthobacter gangjinensis]|uniref:TraB/GumN family protein n=1 Tax=Pontixanthobacter gangjinensis TaxID=1028742 RepID=A0A6I4SPP8_9SPHN|nr:TraB/GumN family protein [Pontixanthobacter gangjinensis]MXO57046.1 TraB/GumN family protein [Pontixanthobacter gangjinensis]